MSADTVEERLQKALVNLRAGLRICSFDRRGFGDHAASTLAKALETNMTVESLHLSSNRIGDRGVERLTAAFRVPTLTSLSLAVNRITDRGVEHLGAALERLPESHAALPPRTFCLNLDDNLIQDAGIQSLCSVARLARLRELRLSNNQLSDHGIQFLAPLLESNTTLRVLGLESNRLGPRAAELLSASWSQNQKLLSLHLRGNRIGDAGIQHLAPALVGKMSAWDLSDMGLGERGAAHIAAALTANSSRTDIISLFLGYNPLGDEGAKHIAAAVKDMKALVSWSLVDCRLGPLGAEYVAAAVHGHTSLGFLDLDSNQLGDGGAESIADALTQDSKGGCLEDVDVADNGIGDAGMEHLGRVLAASRKLTEIRLDGNPFGERGAEHLAAGLKARRNISHADSDSEGGSTDSLPDFADLTVSMAGNMRIGDSGLRHLAASFAELSPGGTWNFSDMGVSDAGAAHVAEALKLVSTCSVSGGHVPQKLNLSKNRLGSCGTQLICEALTYYWPAKGVNMLRSTASPLTTLDLSDNLIGDDGILHLAEALRQKTKLTSLTLAGNQFGDRHLPALLDSLPLNMKTLNLSRNLISAPMVQELRRRAESLPSLSLEISCDHSQLLVDTSSCSKLLETALDGLQAMPPAALLNFKVSFQGQKGVDLGGLRRDFLARAGRALRNPEHRLLLPAPTGCLQLFPSTLASPALDPARAHWWPSLGKIIAVAVLNCEPLGLEFPPSFCKLLLGGTLCFEDLEAVDPSEFRSLRSMRRHQILASRAPPELPGVVILETSGSHGARPGESVHLDGGYDLSGERTVLEVPGLRDHELALASPEQEPTESSFRWLAWFGCCLSRESRGPSSSTMIQPPTSTLTLRRYHSNEVNPALEDYGYTVPSRYAMLHEGQQAEVVAPPAPSELVRSRSPVREESDVQLTTKNLEGYLANATDKLLRQNMEPQFTALKSAFVAGLGDDRFDWPAERWEELQQLLRGAPEVDLAGWKESSQISGFEDNPQVAQWWWEVLQAWSPELQQEALSWCTGWAACPPGGWPRHKSFTLSRAPVSTDHLPRAHLCNFTVDLPEYETRQQLEAKLLQAVKERSFDIA